MRVLNFSDDRIIRLIHNDPIAHRVYQAAVQGGFGNDWFFTELAIALSEARQQVAGDYARYMNENPRPVYVNDAEYYYVGPR